MSRTTRNIKRDDKGRDVERIDNLKTNYSNSEIRGDDSSLLEFENSRLTNLESTNTTVSSIAATTASVSTIKFDTNDVDSPSEIGQVSFNDSDKTLDVKMTDDVTLQIGQEVLIRCVNKTGVDIQNGKLVYVSGAQGNRPKVELADNSNYENSTKTIGMTTENIENNEYGFVTIIGMVRDLNTQGVTEGTRLYLDTNGDYTITKPEPPNPCICIGYVLVEHVTQGIIGVKISQAQNEFGEIDNSNYSFFDTKGTLEAVGEAITWDDLDVRPIQTSRRPAANAPTLTGFIGNIDQYTFSVGDYVANNLEIIHRVKEGSSWIPHIHWATNGSEAVEKEVAWEFEYTYSNANGIANTSSESFATSSVLTASTVISANTPDSSHIVTSFPTVTNVDMEIGGLICYNIKRISSGNEPIDNPFGLQVSAHVQMNTNGSRQVFIKERS